ncbi:MAG: hypothetical protein MMC23_001015 [Stictis urceolatum]|nr:hypothetical protein [Stictis urceolata]
MASTSDMAKAFPFSHREERALEVTERVASTLSILGCLFIVTTFLLSKKFRRPVNRLIFHAALGNLAMNIGTAISLDGIMADVKSKDGSRLCQFQGFLIQMFLPADAFWNLSMAINVYFTVFRKYTAEQLRKLEWIYLATNYGCTFIIALVYCFVQTKANGKMYGPATLWCWVDPSWDEFRVILCYAPAWVAIGASITIYTLAGREIFQKRRELLAFRDNDNDSSLENPFTAYKTTEIHVTSELAEYPIEANIPHTHSRNSIRLDPQSKSMSNCGWQQYSVSISKGPKVINPFRYDGGEDRSGEIKANNVALEANAAAWGYTKCALLFFVSLLITWVPSSIFRVHSLVNHKPGYFPLAYATGLVLPLMGFWNTVIYITTSWSAVKALGQDLQPCRLLVAFGIRSPQSQLQTLGDRDYRTRNGDFVQFGDRRVSERGSVSESLKALAA